MRAPRVTSGSSLKSLMQKAPSAKPTGTLTVSPSGRRTATVSGMSPSRRCIVAATTAAVAQVPVVSPVRRGKKPGSSASTARRRPWGPLTYIPHSSFFIPTFFIPSFFILHSSFSFGRCTTNTITPAAWAASTFSVNPPLRPLSSGRRSRMSVAVSSCPYVKRRSGGKPLAAARRTELSRSRMRNQHASCRCQYGRSLPMVFTPVSARRRPTWCASS